MLKKRFEKMAPKEVYDVFFTAIRERDGKIRVIEINGERTPVFVLNKNPFDKKLILDLRSLSVCQVKIFLGRIVSVNQVLSINHLDNQNTSDKFKEELKKLSDKISQDMKSKFLERLKAKQLAHKEVKLREIKPREIKPKIIKPKFKPKFKPKRPL